MFQIHVISLERSNRREAIAKVLAQRGVAFRFENALDARTLTDEQLLLSYDDRAARARYGRPMTRAEVACFISHRAVWAKIAASGRAAVVLEDDALLDAKFFDNVLHMSERDLIRIADIVQLGRSKLRRESAASIALREPLRRATPLGGMRVGFPFKQWTSGAVGYWISAQAAQAVLDHSAGRISAILDDWPFHRDEIGLRVAELRPYVVWEAFETMPSSIEAERSAHMRERGALHRALLAPMRLARTVMRWLIVLALHVGAKSGAVTRHE